MANYTISASLTAKIRLLDEALKSPKLREKHRLVLRKAKARFQAIDRYNSRLPTRH